MYSLSNIVSHGSFAVGRRGLMDVSGFDFVLHHIFIFIAFNTYIIQYRYRYSATIYIYLIDDIAILAKISVTHCFRAFK